MAEVGNVANITLFIEQKVDEATTEISVGKAQISQVLSPNCTPPSTSISKDGGSDNDTALAVRSFGANLATTEPLMDEQGAIGNVTLLESPSTKAPTLSSVREERSSRNPDRGESKTTSSTSVVVPSVIRISPASPAEKKNNSNNNNAAEAEPSVRKSYSSSVPLVRPRASKTPPHEPAGDHSHNEKKLHPSSEERHETARKTTAVENDRKPSPVTRRGANGGKQASKRDEAKRKDEAQINFPSRSTKRMPPTSGKVPGMPPQGPQVDGVQAPTQHVQYSNNPGGARHHHASRQDPHGYRQQQHGRGVQSSSITSSQGGGTPTLTARRTLQHPRGLSTGSHPGDTESETSPTIPPTPLFQRLVTEEVQELKAYTRIIEEQNRRVTELEHRTADLDKRLQKKTKENTDLERTLEYRETEWRTKFERLERDRDHQKELVEQEKRMNSKLNYQVVQMEQEIHKFLTRKYPQQRGELITGSMRNVRMVHNDNKGSPSLVSGTTSQSPSPSSPRSNDRKKEFKSPREILENDGTVEVVRKRNIASSLLDFFGMP